jgi:hypothetical protein
MSKNKTYTHQQVVYLLGEMIIDSGRAKTQHRAKVMAEAYLELKQSAIKNIPEKNNV